MLTPISKPQFIRGDHFWRGSKPHPLMKLTLLVGQHYINHALTFPMSFRRSILGYLRKPPASGFGVTRTDASGNAFRRRTSSSKLINWLVDYGVNKLLQPAGCRRLGAATSGAPGFSPARKYWRRKSCIAKAWARSTSRAPCSKGVEAMVQGQVRFGAETLETRAKPIQRKTFAKGCWSKGGLFHGFRAQNRSQQ